LAIFYLTFTPLSDINKLLHFSTEPECSFLETSSDNENDSDVPFLHLLRNFEVAESPPSLSEDELNMVLLVHDAEEQMELDLRGDNVPLSRLNDGDDQPYHVGTLFLKHIPDCSFGRTGQRCEARAPYSILRQKMIDSMAAFFSGLDELPNLPPYEGELESDDDSVAPSPDQLEDDIEMNLDDEPPIVNENVEQPIINFLEVQSGEKTPPRTLAAMHHDQPLHNPPMEVTPEPSSDESDFDEELYFIAIEKLM
jgi:hypothetical protein